MQQVIAEGRRLHDAGVPVDEAVGRAAFGDLESWTLRASQGPTAIRRVYLDLDGKSRRQPAFHFSESGAAPRPAAAATES